MFGIYHTLDDDGYDKVGRVPELGIGKQRARGAPLLR
jgi:hypothetical protein